MLAIVLALWLEHNDKSLEPRVILKTPQVLLALVSFQSWTVDSPVFIEAVRTIRLR